MTITEPGRPPSPAEALARLQAWQGVAETRRQLALLRHATRPADTPREG